MKVILGLGMALALAVYSAQAAAPSPTQQGLPGVFYDDAYVMGSPKAKVTLVEYASPVCSHCARFDAEIFPKLKADLIDTGKVRFEFREYLTDPIEIASPAVISARCTGRAGYFAFMEAFFRAQPEMSSGRPGSDPTTVMARIAKGLGVDHDKFIACLTDPLAITKLNQRLDHADQVDHVRGTPTLLVNGVRVRPDEAEWTVAPIERAVADALAQSPMKKKAPKGR